MGWSLTKSGTLPTPRCSGVRRGLLAHQPRQRLEEPVSAGRQLASTARAPIHTSTEGWSICSSLHIRPTGWAVAAPPLLLHHHHHLVPDGVRCSGFADSKTLSEEKRERLYAVIQAEPGLLGYEADVLSAALISGERDGREVRVCVCVCVEGEGPLQRGVLPGRAHGRCFYSLTRHPPLHFSLAAPCRRRAPVCRQDAEPRPRVAQRAGL